MKEPLKILVIDDSEDDRLLYRRALQKSEDLQYDVSETDDGEEGLKRIDAEMPACILLDYSLPGRNGVEILKRIRSKHPFMPVVMLTGQGNEAVAVTAIQEGAQNYIAKSNITPEALQRIIRTAVEHCMLQKRIHEQRTSLEVFTRALAHDLKEPIRTIRSFMELIDQSAEFPGKTRNYFQHVQKAAERMDMLIDTVFLYTRLDGPGVMTGENCDTQVVLQEVKENVAELIREHGAIITAGALPNVHVNRIQLIQLLQNLICNAIKHSEKPVTVTLSAEEKPRHWLFRVSDNGPGIDAVYLQKIFEPFKRLTHQEVQGAGLGLAICKKIVESYGGKIWCESKQGEGAAFLFTLPKALAQSASEPASAKASATAKHTNGMSMANVLLVDDSKADIEITRFKLLERSHLQCNLLVARDADEALDMLRNGSQGNGAVDLLLLDINMPEMDGFELLEKLRADETLKDMNVVMCTGSIYDKDMMRARDLGAIGYLTKPIDFEKLKSVIDSTPAFQLKQEEDHYTLLRAA